VCTALILSTFRVALNNDMLCSLTNMSRRKVTNWGKSWLPRGCQDISKTHRLLYIQVVYLVAILVARHTSIHEVDEMIRGSGEVGRTIMQGWFVIRSSQNSGVRFQSFGEPLISVDMYHNCYSRG
jgi:hypothetical protein